MLRFLAALLFKIVFAQTMFTVQMLEFDKLEEVFDFFYFSVLNFTFFSYGDLINGTVPAKIVVLMEVIIAFLTIIYILSDFISMKDLLKILKKPNNNLEIIVQKKRACYH